MIITHWHVNINLIAVRTVILCFFRSREQHSVGLYSNKMSPLVGVRTMVTNAHTHQHTQVKTSYPPEFNPCI